MPRLRTTTITSGLSLPPSISVPLSRLINTTAPLTGGGNLSADLTLGINTSTFGDIKSTSNNLLTGYNTFDKVLFLDDVQTSGDFSVYGRVSASWYAASGWIGTYGTIAALRGAVLLAGTSSNTITQAYGVQGVVVNSGGGTITNAYGGYFGVQQYPSGTNTTAYGVYVDNIAGVTAYGIYQTGAQPNIFTGSLYNGSIATGNRYVTSGELGAAAGTGTVTNLKVGSNLTIQPAAITTTGTIALADSLKLPGDLQVSGTGAIVYGTVLAEYVQTFGPSVQLLAGTAVGPYNYSFVGSGLLSGQATFSQNLPNDQVIFSSIPTRFTAGSNIVALDNVQASGTVLAYKPLYQGSITSSQRYVTSGELAAGAGSVTSIAAGSNVVLAPNPITTTGSIGLANNLSVPGGIQASGLVQLYNGLSVVSPNQTITYQTTVLADAPYAYWRLGESSGLVAADASGNGRTATYSGGINYSQAGALLDDTNTAVRFVGSGDVQ